MRVYLESLGCRLNAAELERLAREFAGAGCAVVDEPEDADIVLLNTCAVTSQAARKSRQRLRALHRQSAGAHLAVLGCWATEDEARAEGFRGVSWVIPNAQKPRAVEIITGRVASPAAWEPGRWGHTRAFLGVQDGCDHTCTYCITRILRGPARSRPLAEALADVRALVAQSAQEVVLSGVSLGDYGRDLGLEHGLATLVAAILRETTLPRLRLSSVEPWDVDAALLRQWENPRLCRQLHLPLQSGAARVLRRMSRRITPEAFASLVDAARAVSPDIALTTDVIVGFPGETEADFAASLAFVRRMAFARLHVFPYSEREGTPATRLPDSVPAATRAERAAQMRALGGELAAQYRERFVGRALPVLWERRDRRGRWRGWTDNYLAVAAETEAELYNRITETRMVATKDRVMVGEIIPNGTVEALW